MSMRFDDAIPVAASPEQVRAWWTAIDPATIVGRGEDGSLSIRARFGLLRVSETFHVREASWGFWTKAPFGLFVADEFRVEPAEGGSLLRVACTVGCRNLLGRVVLPFYAPVARRQFMRRWREMARACERDLTDRPRSR